MPFQWDEFRLDVEGYALEKGGERVDLEPKAFDLLVLLVSRAGRLVSKQEIFDAVWPATAVSDHALTRAVAQLRRALGDDARESRYIETVPTRGYKWIRRVSEVPGASPSAAVPTQFDRVPTAAPPARRRLAAGALLLGVLTAGLAAWVFWPRAATLQTSDQGKHDVSDGRGDALAAAMFPVQLTTRAGLELQPALAPDGHSIAYATDRSGALEIHVRGLSGEAVETPVTSDGGHNVQPAWSPDGRFIAFHSDRRGGIWVIPARGGIARQLTSEGSHPAWSPDGTMLAFQSDEFVDLSPVAFGAQVGSIVWTVAADGSRPRPITQTGRPRGGHASPTWSPDGRHLAFTVFDGGPDNGVWIVDVKTGDVRALLRGHGMYETVFAPDGSVLYAAGGEPVVWRVRLDARTSAAVGAREAIAVASVPGVRGLSISPGGGQLAFAGLGLSSHLWSLPVTPDGSPAGEPRPLTTDTSRRNSLPVISPDGTRVAYMSRRRGQPPNVWVMGIDGTSPEQMTSDEASDAQPSWYPDSRRVAYVSNRNQRNGLWSVDLDTRREEIVADMQQLGELPPGSAVPRGPFAELRLSPSMGSVAFSVLTPPSGRRVMFVCPLDRFQPRQMTDGTHSVGFPAWAPDERRLAVEVKDGSSTHVAILSLDSGELRRLTSEPGQTWVRSWSPDGRRIAVAALRSGSWSLRWIEVATGRVGRLTPDAPSHAYLRYPEWSPRGSAIVYERGELAGNIWLVKTNIRR